MKRAISLGCALLAGALAACQQTVVLDDRPPDAGGQGTGGSRGDGGGKGGSGPSDASTDGRCFGGQVLSYSVDVPQILVALDRSSAMNASFGTTDQLHAALSAIQADVSKYSGSHNSRPPIQFYFLDFPDTASDCNASSGCCPSDVTSSYGDFQNAATCNGSGPMCLQSTDRPIAAALGRAYEYYAFSSGPPHSNERYVLLVTDGDPQGACPSNNTACTDAETAVAELSSGSVGVTTEVVAIGADAPCLNELATATGVVPSPYYVAPGPNDLPKSIDQIVGTVAQNGCRLTLSAPPTSGHLSIAFDGIPEPQDPGTTGNGWNYDNNTRVFLHGTLCQSFLQSSPNSSFGLQIYDGCLPDHTGQNP